MQSDSSKASALSTEDLLKAYTIGYFPMSEGREDTDVFWVLPEQRGALPLEEFHVPKALRKAVKRDPFEIRVNSAFRTTMEMCAAPATGREDTWINQRILDTYCELHEMGFAHSVESWHGDELVGGLYGVALGGAFFGESMFSRVTNASKVALVYLIARMKYGGYRLLDTQFYTPHLGQFGVREMDKSNYQKYLDSALRYQADFLAMPSQIDGSTILQSITQTS